MVKCSVTGREQRPLVADRIPAGPPGIRTVTRLDGANAVVGVKTMELPCALQLPGHAGLEQRIRRVGSTGAEKLTTIGAAPYGGGASVPALPK